MTGKNIKKYRERKDITQERLAEELNVTRQAVSNWEREKTQPDIETLNRLSQSLGVTIEELIYGEKYHGEKEKLLSADQAKWSIKIGTEAASIGTVLAMILSYAKWGSIGWTIFHGMLSWAYVIYYLIKY